MKNIAVSSPEWITRGAVYQINPRTFSKDGTINVITKELDFLKQTGFDIVYLCPIFSEDDSTDKNNWSERQLKSETENPKNPYRMNDYFFIDSEYGTMDDLKELVCEAHKRNMKVLLDLVYAHIGRNADIIKRHREFVQQTPDGKIINTQWNFPALDFKCGGLREYLYCNMIYYISVIDVDGFRCDVGDFVPDDFWYEAHKRMKTIKPDSILINEGTKYEKLMSSFDVSYCFDWHEKLYKVYCENESAAIVAETDTVQKEYHKLPYGGKILRDMDNHDTVTDWPKRVEIGAGSDGMEQILVLNYIIDGVPMVYAGNEIACSANLSMFANRFHPGKYQTTDRSKKNTPEAIRRTEIIKKLNEFKKQSDILMYGETEWIKNSNPEYTVTFKRKYNGKTIMFAGNTAKEGSTADAEQIPQNAKVLFSNNAAINDGKIDFGRMGYIVVEF